MRFVLLVALALVGCKKDPQPPPPPPAARAICGIPKSHSCTEIYADELVAEAETWCAQEHGIFERNTGCPAERRRASCRLPSGSAEHSYPPRTLADAAQACVNLHGQLVADSELPDAGAPKPYGCMLVKSKLPPIDGTCLEQHSVVDLSLTQDKPNCLTLGGRYIVGECPTEGRVGACDTLEHHSRATRMFYGSSFDAGSARAACDQLKGSFH